MLSSEIYSTSNLQDRILHSDELESFKTGILSNLQSNRDAWIEKIYSILKENGYTKEKMSQLCGVSRSAVAKWCSGAIPSGRDVFIKIGFAAHYGLPEMNSFLQRYSFFLVQLSAR